jgi:hypothetical protein
MVHVSNNDNVSDVVSSHLVKSGRQRGLAVAEKISEKRSIRGMAASLRAASMEFLVASDSRIVTQNRVFQKSIFRLSGCEPQRVRECPA